MEHQEMRRWGALVRRSGWLALTALVLRLYAPATPLAYAEQKSRIEADSAPDNQDRQLLLDAKKLYVEGKYEAAVDKLKQAVEQSLKAGQPAKEQARRYYLLGMAERSADRDEQAILAFRQAVRLNPNHPESRLELALALDRTDQGPEARREAERALQLGLSDADDQKDARELLKDAKVEDLHDRFAASVALSFGYDSNVLVGTIGRCSDMVCGDTASLPDGIANLPQVRQLRGNLTNRAAITSVYAIPLTRQEWDLPASLSVQLSGRLFSRGTVKLWAEYRFYQYLLPSIAYDHDSYNLQEHTVPIYLVWKPRPWLRIRPQVAGFVHFAGLRAFSPLQGGLRSSIEGTFLESAKWSTRVQYVNQFRRSFDRAELSYLDGDRQDVRLTQELAVGWKAVRLHGQLGYRLRVDRSGTFDTRAFTPPSPDPFTIPAAQTGSLYIGDVDYSEPLSYLGNEVLTRWRLELPAGFGLASALSYEYRVYDAPRQAPIFTYPEGTATPRSFALPIQQQKDSLVGFDVSLRNDLPRGFGVELGYSLLYDASTLANWIDNRNYTKHTLTGTLSYTF